MYSRNRPAADVGEPAGRLGAVPLEPLADLDEARLVEDLEVAAEVAVGEAQSSFRSEKRSPLGLVTSEVMIPSLAFSWKTRSSPS